MSSHIHSELDGSAGLITLQRTRALNALSLPMIRDLTVALLTWGDNPAVQVFSLPSVGAIVHALEAAPPSDIWARDTAATLRRRSPLMLHVALEQIRRARGMGLADDLRMERVLIGHCFHPVHLARSAAATNTVEGIRALAVDKDHAPRWTPARIEDVTHDMVKTFFRSPWPAHVHPLRDLQ